MSDAVATSGPEVKPAVISVVSGAVCVCVCVCVCVLYACSVSVCVWGEQVRNNSLCAACMSKLRHTLIVHIPAL